MSSNKEMTKSLLKPENALDLLRVEDQIRVDDDSLTAEIPGRRSNRNGTMYNPTSKASLPGRLTSRNRTIFKKDVPDIAPRSSTVCTADIESIRTKQDSNQSMEFWRTNTVV